MVTTTTSTPGGWLQLVSLDGFKCYWFANLLNGGLDLKLNHFNIGFHLGLFKNGFNLPVVSRLVSFAPVSRNGFIRCQSGSVVSGPLID